MHSGRFDFLLAKCEKHRRQTRARGEIKRSKKLDAGGGGGGGGKEYLPHLIICLYPCKSPVLLPLGMQAS